MCDNHDCIKDMRTSLIYFLWNFLTLSVNIENVKGMSFEHYFGGVCIFDEASG